MGASAQPVRTCVSCREKSSKHELLRFTPGPEGVMMSSTGTESGRGAYICRDERCWEIARGGSVLGKALRTAADANRLEPAVREAIDRKIVRNAKSTHSPDS